MKASTMLRHYEPSTEDITRVAESVLPAYVDGYGRLDIEECVSVIWNELRLSSQSPSEIPASIYVVVRSLSNNR